MAGYIEVAQEAAKLAGKYLLENRGKIKPENIDEKARNDFVTYVDKNSEKMIVELLLEKFPDHRILAEEGTVTDSDADYRWIIDPLDGTKNYIQDVPVFCVSIALQKKKELIAGVIYDPVRNEIFTAEKGGGAFCNGEPMHVGNRNLKESLIATGFPFRSKDYLPLYMLAFEEIFLGCSGMRRLGSAALDLAYTAKGRFDGFWELGLSVWDIAAGSLMVQEAGGVVSDFWGKNQYLNTGFIIAGPQPVHSKLLEIIPHHFPVKIEQ